MPRPWMVLGACGLLAWACNETSAPRSDPGGQAALQESEPLEFASVEEMRVEIEILDNEIRGLEEYLAANPGWTPPTPSDPDPRAVLEAARATRDAASSALAAADTAQAADSLRAASARIEHVKRLLGVAEEMGIDFELEPTGESLPPGD